jgi:hypothetical protein
MKVKDGRGAEPFLASGSLMQRWSSTLSNQQVVVAFM